MDLIDLHQYPDNGFKHILHVRDHFSRYSWAKPLISKEPIVIAGILYEIFCQFEPPVILQSDNGKEFTSRVIISLAELWSGIRLVNGRPRYTWGIFYYGIMALWHYGGVIYYTTLH